MKQLITFAFLAISLSTFGQVSHSISKFNELEVTDKIPVTVILSDKDSLIIKGELASQVEVIQGDNIVRLKMAAGNLMKGDQVEATLYTSNFQKVSARKGAIVLSGNSTFTPDSLSVVANEGAKIDLSVKTNHVEIYSNSGSSIELDGTAKRQNINIFAGGAYDAKALVSESVTARVNAGGKCIVHATEFADVQTRAGGSIQVYGSPKEKKQKKLAGGSISFL
ncbi:GIN domain-containing protein [Sphingobacterium hungaricum]